jgi:Domain of unknown function (DUF4394)
LTGLSGSVFSVDFNPVADRLRVISDDGQSLRIVVETATASGVTVTAGSTTTDGAINRASGPASVVASAYTNSFAGTGESSLYNLEQTSDQLTLQNPPNNGVLTDIGPLGLNISGTGGFDIGGGDNGIILAALRGRYHESVLSVHGFAHHRGNHPLPQHHGQHSVVGDRRRRRPSEPYRRCHPVLSEPGMVLKSLPRSCQGVERSARK